MNSIVRTKDGRLRGIITGGVHSFKGIPYAAPPFGTGRLRPPRPVGAWAGIRDAQAFGFEPPQLRPPAGHPAAGMVFDPAIPGEDCLNLNVWTPDPSAIGLPVMVWIPGGMFEVGTGASYDGSRFARDGVVCVTINYRVGPEGFMYLADGDANLGLRDQIAALEWVRDHIADFGGDPANVTIFGESSGAMSVGTLLAVPRASGLFRRAITQSGAADRVIPAPMALQIGHELAGRLGIDATRAAMTTVAPERLLLAAAEIKAEIVTHPDPARWGLDIVASALPWQPVIDGDLLPAHPIERIAAGSAAEVDVMAGWNTDDWRLFVVVNGSFDRVTDEIASGPVGDYGFETAAAYGLSADDLNDYRRAHPGTSPGELLSIIETDWWCRLPARRLADAHASSPSGTYRYAFAWPSPAFGGLFGACHALEIPFVFDTLDLGASQMQGALLGTEPPQRLADAMHGAWLAFATTGDPGWPRYESQRRTTMRFDVTSAAVEGEPVSERPVVVSVS
jgi:para-nitrobenzyl esterase